MIALASESMLFLRLALFHRFFNPSEHRIRKRFCTRGECWPLAGKLVSLKNVSFAAAFGAMFFAKCFEFRMFVMEARIAE